MSHYRSAAIDKLLSGGQSKTWLITNALVTITTSGGVQTTNGDTPVSSDSLLCSNCGWAEVLIRRPTGNISWLMRLQNQVGVATAGTPMFSSIHTNDIMETTSLSHQSSDVIGHSEKLELSNHVTDDLELASNQDGIVTPSDLNVGLGDERLFQLELDNGEDVLTTQEPHPPQLAAIAGQRSRHTSTCSLELLPPLMSYEESQVKSPSLHEGSGKLTDEEQV